MRQEADRASWHSHSICRTSTLDTPLGCKSTNLFLQTTCSLSVIDRDCYFIIMSHIDTGVTLGRSTCVSKCALYTHPNVVSTNARLGPIDAIPKAAANQ